MESVIVVAVLAGIVSFSLVQQFWSRALAIEDAPVTDEPAIETDAEEQLRAA